MKTMKERFQDWLDLDFAGFELMIVLGILSEDRRDIGQIVMNSNDATGAHITRMLYDLVDAGVLETREFQFRWNPSFCGSWQESITPREPYPWTGERRSMLGPNCQPVPEASDQCATIARTLHFLIHCGASRGWLIDDIVKVICGSARYSGDDMKRIFEQKTEQKTTGNEPDEDSVGG